MAELKTKITPVNVDAFIESITDEQKRNDCKKLKECMQEISGSEPKMWGNSIVGFGTYHYKYESGREGDWFLTGFSPRKQALSIYLMPGFSRFDKYLDNLGKYKTGKGCLYVKKLTDIDMDLLKKMIADSVEILRQKYS